MDGMKAEMPNKRLTPRVENCLFAETAGAGVTIGVVSAAEPSSLALLAAGVAGMAARRARRERAISNAQPASKS